MSPAGTVILSSQKLFFSLFLFCFSFLHTPNADLLACRLSFFFLQTYYKQVIGVSDATKAVRRDRGNATFDLLFVVSLYILC